jgi:hypothetical protein
MSHSRAKVPMVNKRFGRLVVVREVPERNALGHILYECRCDCGAAKEILGASMRQGNTTSCGCAQREATSTHGMDGTPTCKAWRSMRSRCHNPSVKQYKRYGGRGIQVCDRWMSFDNFLADMGVRPDGLSLDRIDVNGNYEPSNCRWADAKVQANNRRNNLRVCVGGHVLGVEQFAEHCGLTLSGARKRIHRDYKKATNGIYVKESDLAEAN